MQSRRSPQSGRSIVLGIIGRKQAEPVKRATEIHPRTGHANLPSVARFAVRREIELLRVDSVVSVSPC